MFRSTTSRVLAGLGATAALVLAAPLAASAHVTIDPADATAGSYPTVEVRVPTESDTALSDDDSDTTTTASADAGSGGGVPTGAALGLGISGLVLGAAALIVGVLAYLRTRRSAA